MPQAFYILLGATLTVATAIALGRLLFRALALRFPRGEEYVFALVTGAACLSLLVFALTAVGLAYKAVFLAVAAVAIVAHLRLCGPTTLADSDSRLASGDAHPTAIMVLFALVFAAFTYLYFFNAMAPETSPDGATYHLGLVSRYLREHGFHRITTNIYASLSQGFEMLFLFAFAFGRHSAAALVHFAFTVTLALAMFFYGRRIGQPLAGAAGALFVFCSPVVGIDGTSAYNDVGVACVLFTVFYLLQIWDQERTPALLIPIGLVAGFGYAIKYTAFLALPFALAFVAWKSVKTGDRQRCPRGAKTAPWDSVASHLSIIAACALVMILPWMVKNWLWVQNPVSPFLNQLFPNPYVHISFEKEYAHHMRHYVGLASYWQLPRQVTVDGSIAGGILGPLFLLAPFSLLALRNRHGRQLLLAALVFGISYAGNVGTRFLIPALPFIALAMALVFVRWRALVVTLVLAHAVLSWPPMIRKYAPQVWRLSNEIPVRAALRIEPEERFLARKCIPYVIGRTVESFVPPGKRVFAPSPTGEAYTGREVLVTYEGALNQVIGDMLWTPWVPEYAATRRLSFRFPPEAFRQLRVVQTASDDLDKWSIAEFHLFRNGQELALDSAWRLRAKPFPWDVGYAFDRNPITRWCSWQSLYPGMYVEVEFPNPETVDSVALDCSRDQDKIRLKLEGRTVSGVWKTVTDAPVDSAIPPPPDIRRATAREMKALGIDYIVMSPDDFGAADLRARTADWGVTLVADRGGTCLYRID